MAYLIATRGGSVEAIALTGLAGEAASLLIAYGLIAAARGWVRPSPGARRSTAIALVLVLLLAAMAAGLVAGPLPAIAAMALFLAVLSLSARLRGYLATRLLKRSKLS